MTEFIWVKDIKQYPHFFIEMFGNKEITKALELAIHSDDCDEWLLAVQGEKLLAFSGYEIQRQVFVLKRAFVFSPYRKFGIYKMMLDMRIQKAIESLKVNTIQATATPMSKNEFIKRGFKSLKQFKRFQTFRMML